MCPKVNTDIYKTMLCEYPDVLNVAEVSIILDVCTKTVYKLLRENKIKHFRIGNKYIIPKLHLIEYLIK